MKAIEKTPISPLAHELIHELPVFGFLIARNRGQFSMSKCAHLHPFGKLRAGSSSLYTFPCHPEVGAFFCNLSFMNTLSKTPISPFVATTIHNRNDRSYNWLPKDKKSSLLIFNEQMHPTINS
jgi:hypothetical protein